MSKKTQLLMFLVLVCVLSAGLIIAAGCKCPWAKDKHASIEQTACPLSGKPVNKEISTEYKGKTVFFCSPNCKTAFEKEPEKFVGKLPQFQSSYTPRSSY